MGCTHLRSALQLFCCFSRISGRTEYETTFFSDYLLLYCLAVVFFSTWTRCIKLTRFLRGTAKPRCESMIRCMLHKESTVMLRFVCFGVFFPPPGNIKCLRTNMSFVSSTADSGASLADRESSLDLIKLDISRTFPSLFIFQKVCF